MNFKYICFLILGLVFSTIVKANAQQQKTILENFIDKKKAYNKNSKNGFAVLLYNGNEEMAREIYKQFQEDYTDIAIKLSYVSPNWKVITTTYSSVLEAENLAIKIRKKFPNAKVL